MEKGKFSPSLDSIPSLESCIDSVSRRLKENFSLGMILVDTLAVNEVETHFKENIDYSVLQAFYEFLTSLSGSFVRSDDIIAVNITGGHKYYIFLSKPREKAYFTVDDYEKIASRIGHSIEKQYLSTIFPSIQKGCDVLVGYSVCFYNPRDNAASQLQRLIDTAGQMAKYRQVKSNMQKTEMVYRLITEENVSGHFQPIINLASQELIGYEAFTRGPKDTVLESPYLLFSYTRDLGLLFELDWICKKTIITSAKHIDKNTKLFIKTLPSSVHDTDLRVKLLYELLNDQGISPESVVFEISEKCTHENQSLLGRLLKFYDKINFAFVVDETWTDVNFAILKELGTAYLKINMSLVRDIHKNPRHQEHIRQIMNFAGAEKIPVIAEGIHNELELKELLQFQIFWGQGYFIAKPDAGLAPIQIMDKYIKDKDLHKKLLASIYFKRGKDYFNNGQYDKAILEFSKVIEFDKENQDSLYFRSYALYEDGGLVAAKDDLRLLLKLNPGYSEAILLKAMILEKQKRSQEAVAAYEEYIGLAPPAFRSQIEMAQSRIAKLTKS